MSKKSYHELESGYEFPPSHYEMDKAMVSAYREAVEEESPLYRQGDIVPPTAVAACALASLSQNIEMPPGAIHIGQDLEFLDLVKVGDTITCRAKIGRKQDRGKLHIFAIDLRVENQHSREVMAGKTSFILPEG